MGESFGLTVATDFDGRITHWSKQAEDTFGFDEDDAIGLHVVKRLFTRADLVRGYSIFAEALTGREWEGQVYAKHRSGMELPLLVRFVPVRDEDGIVSGVLFAGTVIEHQTYEGIDLHREFRSYLIGER